MSTFEKDEIIRELREGHIVFTAYLVNKDWWDTFWQKLMLSSNIPNVDSIDNTSLM
jgi:hypothetical protein